MDFGFSRFLEMFEERFGRQATRSRERASADLPLTSLQKIAMAAR